MLRKVLQHGISGLRPHVTAQRIATFGACPIGLFYTGFRAFLFACFLASLLSCVLAVLLSSFIAFLRSCVIALWLFAFLVSWILAWKQFVFKGLAFVLDFDA